jgi:thymidylate synthase
MDKQYKELLHTILNKGYWYDDPNRKETKRLQINDYKLTHNFEDGFPITTSKKTYYKGAFGELLVFLRGENNLKVLHNNGVKFWNKDAHNYYIKLCNDNQTSPVDSGQFLKFTEQGNVRDYFDGYRFGDLGKIYPYQMRKWNDSLDQIQSLVNTLRTTPLATKKTVTMWNPSDLQDCCLSPCHWSFEALVTPLKESYEGHIVDFGKEVFSEKTKVWRSPKYGLTIKWHQHSTDVFLGLPLNITYYSGLCYLLAELLNMKPLGVIGDLSNVHLYDNAIEGAKKQLEQKSYSLPTFEFSIKAKRLLKKYKGVVHTESEYYRELDKVLLELSVEDFIVENYECSEVIKVEMLAYKN